MACAVSTRSRAGPRAMTAATRMDGETLLVSERM